MSTKQIYVALDVTYVLLFATQLALYLSSAYYSVDPLPIKFGLFNTVDMNMLTPYLFGCK